MVSVYRNPPPNLDFSHSHTFYTNGDPTKVDSNMLPMVPPANAGSGVDDPNKKIRKPYTITKSRESWSEQEHDKFLEALQLFDRDWKKIEAFVGSKTVIQSQDVWSTICQGRYWSVSNFVDVIRSHAQKYFLKVQKNGTSEHVPPPRPKRKAAHPYPQKASKALPRSTGHVQSSAARVETGYAVGHDSFSITRDPIGSATLPSWSYNVVPTESLPHIPKDDVVLANVANNYSSSSSDSTPCLWASNETTEVKARQCNTTRVIPDFSQVYQFIGSIFDPTATNHMQRLRKMQHINVETVLMLMKNLCVNLASPEFEDHRKLLSSYKAGSENVRARSEIPSA